MVQVGIIGFQDDVIGFGLAGVKQAVEVKRESNAKEIIEALELIKEVSILLVNESILEKIKHEEVLLGKFVVTIPNNETSYSEKKIDNLVRETLGIIIKNNDEE